MFGARKPTVYIQLSPKQLSLRDTASGETVTTLPEIAVERASGKIVAIGTKARHQESPAVQVLNPFAHQRTLLADDKVAAQLLRVLLKRLPLKRSFLSPGPAFVLHLQGDPAGGFTPVEVRAFRAMAQAAGAAEVILWQGPNLGDQQLLGRQFPNTGKVLG